MIKPYIKSETAVDIICSICDRIYPGMDCEPADCEWMKMLAEEAVDAVPVVRCKDCIHGFFHNSSGGMYCCTSPAGLSLETPNSFCCYGERKEEPHDRLQKDL